MQILQTKQIGILQTQWT